MFSAALRILSVLFFSNVIFYNVFCVNASPPDYLSESQISSIPTTSYYIKVSNIQKTWNSITFDITLQRSTDYDYYIYIKDSTSWTGQFALSSTSYTYYSMMGAYRTYSLRSSSDVVVVGVDRTFSSYYSSSTVKIRSQIIRLKQPTPRPTRRPTWAPTPSPTQPVIPPKTLQRSQLKQVAARMKSYMYVKNNDNGTITTMTQIKQYHGSMYYVYEKKVANKMIQIAQASDIFERNDKINYIFNGSSMISDLNFTFTSEKDHAIIDWNYHRMLARSPIYLGVNTSTEAPTQSPTPMPTRKPTFKPSENPTAAPVEFGSNVSSKKSDASSVVVANMVHAMIVGICIMIAFV